MWSDLYECWSLDVWAVGATGGMPDLLLWNAERQEAKLSEVKGPRDRMAAPTRAWDGDNAPDCLSSSEPGLALSQPVASTSRSVLLIPSWVQTLPCS